MNPIQCEKCGETVDAAKAFCPGCGAAMVAEEQRTNVSEFDASAGTVQFGKTVYNQMLSDMGLNIADLKTPTREPAAEPARTAPEEKAVPVAKKSYMLWIVTAAVAGLLLLAIVIFAAIFAFYR